MKYVMYRNYRQGNDIFWYGQKTLFVNNTVYDTSSALKHKANLLKKRSDHCIKVAFTIIMEGV